MGGWAPEAPSPFVVELVAEDPTWHIFAVDVEFDIFNTGQWFSTFLSI